MTSSLFATLGTNGPSMLFAGNLRSYSTGAGLVQGFRALGWDVAEVSVHDALITADQRLLRLAAKVTLPLAIRDYNQAIMAQATRLRPSVMLTVKGMYILPETLRALRSMKIATVNFYPDYKFEYAGFDETWLGEYDLVATTKSFQVEYLAERIGAARVAMVHHGYVPDLHRRRAVPGQSPQFLWDIAYVGNASANKLSWLTGVARAFPDRSLIIVGNNWRHHAAGTPLERHVLGYPLIGDYFARVTEHSRINLAVHHGNAGSTHGWEDLVSTRTFEIPACGGFMLHVDNPEVRALYQPGLEMDVFADERQLIERIGHYLANETERAAIGEAGYARCVPAYSLEARAGEVAALLTERGLLRNVL
ncbi:MAG TPA: glycosyltransferase [Sphingomonas sp.]|nr:glycosyltransferase [Sphingomonas sp.]